MFDLVQAGRYWRFARGLRGFLKEPLTPTQSGAIVSRRLAEREKNLLKIIQQTVYGYPNSPYLKLLKHAGCGYGDFEKLVLSDGVETTLEKLRQQGVYLTIEEAKAKKDVVRGGTKFRVRPRDLNNPLSQGTFEIRSSGSRSAGTRTIYDFDHLTDSKSVYVCILLEAFDVLKKPLITWYEILPGLGPIKLLRYTKAGKVPDSWFAPFSLERVHLPLRDRVGTNLIVLAGRLCGKKFPFPEYVSIEEARVVAQRIAEAVKGYGGCFVECSPSRAVAISQASKQSGFDISETVFYAGGEPITVTKRREIESAGCRICPRYVFVEGGYVGLGCFNPSESDDVHLLKDSLALIQYDREVVQSGTSVNAFLFTSLLPTTPKILLNVESGDYGVIEKRQCGCAFENLGLTDHIHSIRSFEKLTGLATTFYTSELIKIIEEVLPSKFGGASIHYQMVEEEDEMGHTRVSIYVHPQLGEIDELELRKTVLGELSKGSPSEQIDAKTWEEAGTLRVKRMPPLSTTRGKVLHLHIKNQK